MSELEKVFESPKKVKLSTRDVEIKTIKLGTLPTVLKLVSAAMESIPKNKKDDINIIALKAFTNHYELVLEVFEITTNLTLSEIKNLELDEGLLVLTYLIKENADFLSQKVLPLVQDLVKAADGLNKSKG